MAAARTPCSLMDLSKKPGTRTRIRGVGVLGQRARSRRAPDRRRAEAATSAHGIDEVKSTRDSW